MSEQPTDVQAEWAALADECLVHRAVLKPADVDKRTKRVLKGAFLRRSPKADGTPRDTKGLSVMLAEHCTVDDIRRSLDVSAVCDLTVVQVRTAADTAPFLDVIQDEINHANIIGLPAYKEDEIRAENLASELANRCKVVYEKSTSR